MGPFSVGRPSDAPKPEAASDQMEQKLKFVVLNDEVEQKKFIGKYASEVMARVKGIYGDRVSGSDLRDHLMKNPKDKEVLKQLTGGYRYHFLGARDGLGGIPFVYSAGTELISGIAPSNYKWGEVIDHVLLRAE